MVVKPCPRCKRLMPVGPAYCKDCAPIAQAELEAIKERNRQKKIQNYNRSRQGTKYYSFYNSKPWKLQSRAKLEAAGWKCQARHSEKCTGIACEVHHLKPIQTPEGWDKRLDWENLIAVCTSCHNVYHPEKLKRQHQDGVIDLRTVKR